MPALSDATWDLLFELPELRATLDELPHFVFTETVRAGLCARYELSPQQLASIINAHGCYRAPRSVAGLKARGRVPAGRSGPELLRALPQLPQLRQLLDADGPTPDLCARILRLRRERFHLSRTEMVWVLNAHAHAEAWAQA